MHCMFLHISEEMEDLIVATVVLQAPALCVALYPQKRGLSGLPHMALHLSRTINGPAQQTLYSSYRLKSSTSPHC